MSGGLPTGDNPAYFDPHPFSIVGAGFSTMGDRTEVNVRPILEDQVRNDPGLTSTSDTVFSGLNPVLGLPGAVIKAALQMITGVPLAIVGGGLNAVLGAFRGIPASAIVDEDSENLLFNPQFNVDLNGWTSSVTGITPHYVQDGSEGKAVSGSAKVVAGGGVTKTLRSTRIPVAKDNNVKVSAWYKLTGGTGTANPIRVHLRYFDANGTLLGFSTIGSVTGTGTVGTWTEITSAPVTPTDIHPTCRTVEVELSISSTMTAGTVWWDDCLLQKGGLIPQTLIGGLVDALTGLVDGTLFQNLLDTLAGAGAGLGSLLGIGNRLNFLNPDGTFDASQLMNLANIPAGIAQGAVTGLTTAISNGLGFTQGVITGLFNAFTGQAQSNVPTASLEQQAAAIAENQVALAAAVAALQANQDAGQGSGLSGGDDFERVDNDDAGTGWDVTYTGGGTSHVAILDGHNLGWNKLSSTFRECKLRRTDPLDALTLTDYQIITMVDGPNVIEAADWFSNTDARNSMYGRMNSAGTHYVRVNMNLANAAFYTCVGGVETQRGSTITITRAAGTIWQLVCGNVGNLRLYQLRRNGQTVFTWDDATLITSVGPSYRGWGIGMGGGNQKPSNVNRVTISDNVPPAVTGTTMRVSRTGGNAGVNSMPVGDNVLPNNIFDTVDYKSDDITWNSATTTVTFTKSKTYIITLKVNVTTVWSSVSSQLMIQKNGVTVAKSEEVDIGGTDATWQTTDRAFTFVHYFEAGDTMRPMAFTSAAREYSSSNGGDMYMSIVGV